MKRFTRRLIALAVCAALCLSCAGLALAEPEARGTKDETVYVLTGSDGAVRKIIVSDWLKNASGADSLTDSSILENIENVKGEEGFTADGESLTWNAAGSDIYYQGTTDKALPVTLTVSCQLDGQELTPAELAGRSGHVTIRFDYENLAYETVELNGASETVYMPFVAVTGMVLDNACFRNVEVTNGKLVNDGDRTAVVGIALPGMQENLGVEKGTLELPDYVEIRADVTDFKMGMTLTLVTSEPFRALGDSRLDSADDVTEAVNKLTDALTQLTDGTGALTDGLATLLEKTGELTEGVQQLSDGASALHDGASALQTGASELSAGAAELSGGLSTLVSNNATLVGGAEQVFNTLLATAATQLRSAGINVQELTIENYDEVLSGILGSLSTESVTQQARAQVAAAVEANRAAVVEAVTAAVRQQVSVEVTQAVRAEVEAQVTQAIRAQVEAQVISSVTGMSADDYAAAVAAGQVSAEQQAAISAAVDDQMAGQQSQIAAATDAQMAGQDAQAAISANLEKQMESAEVQSLLAQNVEAQITALIDENMQSAEVQSKLAQASAGHATISELKASLDSYNSFYTGLKAYTDGVSSASDGAAALTDGSAELCTGAAQLTEGAGSLYDGIGQLQGSLPALVDGVTQLHDGAQQLSDGLNQLADEGLQKLSGLVGGDLDTLLARLNAIADAARGNHSFTGLDGSMDGQVRFLYRTDEVK